MADELKTGDSGPAVTTAQALLNYYSGSGNRILEDGIFGPVTRQKVVEFQRSNHLLDDGHIGPETSRALLSARRLDASGQFYRPVTVGPVRLDTRRMMTPPPAERPLKVPEWFSNNLPKRPWYELSSQDKYSWRWDNLQLSLGQEHNIAGYHNSAPLQMAAEFFYLRSRDEGGVFSVGGQGSYTPRSEDGKWVGQIYTKSGIQNFGVPELGILSLFNPSVQTYVKAATRSPLLMGTQFANETDITLFKREGRYSAQMYLNIGIQFDFLDLEEFRFRIRQVVPVIGLGFKFTLFRPDRPTQAPGRTDYATYR